MPAHRTVVQEAVRRWRAKALIDDTLARSLLEEAEQAEGVRGRRQGQRVLAGVGAVLLLGTALVFWTMNGAFRAHYVATALAVAALGAGGMTLALRGGLLQVLPASALAVVVAAWYLAAEAGGALPAALALAFTAGLFFWTSGRMGRERAERAARAPTHGSD